MKKENKVLFTPQGLEELKKEYEDLIKNQRPAVLEELQSARALGDLSENAMYSVARERQSFVENRIREVEDLLKRAEVAVGSKNSTGKNSIAEIGKTVLLETPKNKVQYALVGAEEVNFSQNKISNESPLGKAILGKKVGETVEVEAPAGIVKYKIIEIN